MFFTNLLGLDREYIDQLEHEEYWLIKELEKETDRIRKKNIYSDLVKINNTRIIYDYERIPITALRMALIFINDEFGDNNTFIDWLTNDIDYELEQDDIECLVFSVCAYDHWYKKAYKDFKSLCKMFTRELKKLERKYIDT